jgi:hypothetical protein
MRDHLLGFAPVALTAAAREDACQWEPGPMDRGDFCPLGESHRHWAEYHRHVRHARERMEGQTHRERSFESGNRALPDGSVMLTDKELAARRAAWEQQRADKRAADDAEAKRLAEFKKRQDADADLLRKQVEAAFDICVAKGVIAPVGRAGFARAVAEQSSGCMLGQDTGVYQTSAGLMAACGGASLTTQAPLFDTQRAESFSGFASVGESSPLGRALARNG